MDYLSLCLICKDENDYLPEWLDYHILAGVERFYIYDNDSQVSLRKSLRGYIERGWVVVVDIPGSAMQMYAYDHCLRQFGGLTRWLGFIDTDEFLVVKTTTDLKEFLRNYEDYAGLAVSSLFFGSNGCQQRPAKGQLSSYLLRTDENFSENMLIKSIVQPGRVVGPASPHEFYYQPNQWCVNEKFLRVDNQHFPNYTEKIQLNHYYCRSESEIVAKIARGRGDSTSKWPRQRFDSVNLLSTIPDRAGLELAKKLAQLGHFATSEAGAEHGPLIERMARLSAVRRAFSIDIPSSHEVLCRDEITTDIQAKLVVGQAERRGDNEVILRETLKMMQINPHHVGYYYVVAVIYLRLGQAAPAWQALAQAWKLSPNSYHTLKNMVSYFLHVKNYDMAEKSCRLLLDIAPHDLTALAFLTQTFLGQGRYEEALKVGTPVVELAGLLGELPNGTDIFFIQKMAAYLETKKDFRSAAHLWAAGTKCQPGDGSVMLEWAKSLLLCGDNQKAQLVLDKALIIAPENNEIRHLARQFAPAAPLKSIINKTEG